MTGRAQRAVLTSAYAAAELGVFAAGLALGRSAGHGWARALLEGFLMACVAGLLLRGGSR